MGRPHVLAWPHATSSVDEMWTTRSYTGRVRGRRTWHPRSAGYAPNQPVSRMSSAVRVDHTPLRWPGSTPLPAGNHTISTVSRRPNPPRPIRARGGDALPTRTQRHRYPRGSRRATLGAGSRRPHPRRPIPTRGGDALPSGLNTRRSPSRRRRNSCRDCCVDEPGEKVMIRCGRERVAMLARVAAGGPKRELGTISRARWPTTSTTPRTTLRLTREGLPLHTNVGVELPLGTEDRFRPGIELPRGHE